MILVFGATGFTGRMVVDDLVARGLPVRIAGRSKERLIAQSKAHGDLEWTVADVKDPGSVARAAKGAKVLVTTVGPYSWWGHIAAEAAIDEAIPYIDITGEPAFLRDVFEKFGPRAAAAGVAMLPSIGYDYVPGNLAGALALEAAGPQARRVDVGYFLSGENARSLKSFSGGTLRSLRASGSAEQYRWHDGRIEPERAAKRVLKFDLGGREATAVSIGSTEHYSLPKLHPQLRDVNVGLGWFGPAAGAVKLASAVGEQVEKLPVVGGIVGKVGERISGTEGPSETKRRTRPAGPDDRARANAQGRFVAVARDERGTELASVHMQSPNPYDLTGLIVGWAAERAAAGEIGGVGALGPVEAFGLEPLRAACESFGLREL
ncbi:MAG: NAD(P)H-binding protein [Actinobacteria bacterium]|nr:NAD(P)H-binding protein [Actinomycetota bacterium]